MTGQTHQLVTIEVRSKTNQQWSPLELNKTYVVATNTFLRLGGDGYAILLILLL